MPYKPARSCAVCGALTTNKERFCDYHLKQRNQIIDANRGTPSERGYDSRWTKARTMYLREHPLCVMCERENMVVAAEVVDHIHPHHGDHLLMWDPDNWQSLCKRDHDIKTAKEDGAFGNVRKT